MIFCPHELLFVHLDMCKESEERGPEVEQCDDEQCQKICYCLPKCPKEMYGKCVDGKCSCSTAPPSVGGVPSLVP